MSFDGILFDKNGTVVDYDRTWSAATSALLLGLSKGDDELYRRLAEACPFDPRTWLFAPSASLLTDLPEQLARVLAPALGRRDVKRLAREVEAQYRDCSAACLTPIGSPEKLFRYLSSSGLRLGMACNDLVQDVRQQASQLGVLEHLDFVAGRDSGFGRKPAAGMIVAFAVRFGLAPERVAVVGDRLHDLQAARAAGATAIAVLTGSSFNQDLSPHADYVIDSAADLPRLIDRLRRPLRLAYG